MRKRSVLVGIIVALFALVNGGVCGEPAPPADQVALKAVVHAAALGLNAVAVSQDGTYDVNMVRKYVDAVRFLEDNTGYLFVYDYTNNFNIAHAILKDFEGKDKTQYQDSRGMYTIQELSKIAKSPAGGGTLVYYWNNPQSGKEEKKLGYIEVIPGTTLYVGSGVYLASDK